MMVDRTSDSAPPCATLWAVFREVGARLWRRSSAVRQRRGPGPGVTGQDPPESSRISIRGLVHVPGLAKPGAGAAMSLAPAWAVCLGSGPEPGAAPRQDARLGHRSGVATPRRMMPSPRPAWSTSSGTPAPMSRPAPLPDGGLDHTGGFRWRFARRPTARSAVRVDRRAPWFAVGCGRRASGHPRAARLDRAGPSRRGRGRNADADCPQPRRPEPAFELAAGRVRGEPAARGRSDAAPTRHALKQGRVSRCDTRRRDPGEEPAVEIGADRIDALLPALLPQPERGVRQIAPPQRQRRADPRAGVAECPERYCQVEATSGRVSR